MAANWFIDFILNNLWWTMVFQELNAFYSVIITYTNQQTSSLYLTGVGSLKAFKKKKTWRKNGLLFRPVPFTVLVLDRYYKAL